MKQLQNNFTSPKQSRRLLELGLPADSADMHFSYASNQTYSAPKWNNVRVTAYQFYFPTLDIIPCWSVGRLIEIYEICTGVVWQNEIIDGYSKVDMLLEDFEDNEKKYTFDFSRLEN